MDMGCNEGLVRLADCAGAEELGCSVGGDGSSVVNRYGADMFGVVVVYLCSSRGFQLLEESRGLVWCCTVRRCFVNREFGKERI